MQAGTGTCPSHCARNDSMAVGAGRDRSQWHSAHLYDVRMGHKSRQYCLFGGQIELVGRRGLQEFDGDVHAGPQTPVHDAPWGSMGIRKLGIFNRMITQRACNLFHSLQSNTMSPRILSPSATSFLVRMISRSTGGGTLCTVCSKWQHRDRYAWSLSRAACALEPHRVVPVLPILPDIRRTCSLPDFREVGDCPV